MGKNFFKRHLDGDNDDVLKTDGFSDVGWSEEELEKAANENSVNQKNAEEFQQVMSNASRNLDGYWDKNNIIVRIVTYLIWAFAILGILYYLILWFSNN